MRIADIYKVTQALLLPDNRVLADKDLLDIWALSNATFNERVSPTEDYKHEDLAGYMWKVSDDGSFYEFVACCNPPRPLMADLYGALLRFQRWMEGKAVEDLKGVGATPYDVDSLRIIAHYAEFWISVIADCYPDIAQPVGVLPPELNTPQADEVFKKAVDLGLMTSDYRWLKGKEMAACFAREMSLLLGLGKGENENGAPRISWAPFEKLFHFEKLRSNFNDIQKTGQEPTDAYLLKEIFP